MVDSSLKCNFEEMRTSSAKGAKYVSQGQVRAKRSTTPLDRCVIRPRALKVRNRIPLNMRAMSLLQSSIQFGAAPGAARFAIAQHFHPGAAAAPGTPACPWLTYSAPLALNPKPAALMRVALPN